MERSVVSGIVNHSAWPHSISRRPSNVRYHFHTLDVFTADRFAGNQLAVLPEASGLNSAQMQSIAREFAISETVFVLPPENPAHSAKIRIFTPGKELPFAGHPTIGTAVLLADLKEQLRPGMEDAIIVRVPDCEAI